LADDSQRPNWLRIEIEKVMDGMNDLAKANSMVHAKVLSKVDTKGELVIAMVFPSNYAKAFRAKP
jgi:hypothetical protein